MGIQVLYQDPINTNLCLGVYWICSKGAISRAFPLTLADLGSERVASLLGVSQKHRCVRFVEDRVVHGGIANSERSLHHDDLGVDKERSE